MTPDHVVGMVPQVIADDRDYYAGNLAYYFRILFREGEKNPGGYHGGVRHPLHATVLFYKALAFYWDRVDEAGRSLRIDPEKARDGMIGMLWHDIKHSLGKTSDDENINRSVAFLYEEGHPSDCLRFPRIARVMWATRFPYDKIPDAELNRIQGIARDADGGQAYDHAWLDLILFGLGSEIKKTPTEMLDMQPGFLKGRIPCTTWGRAEFSPAVVEAKIVEAMRIRALLDPARYP